MAISAVPRFVRTAGVLLISFLVYRTQAQNGLDSLQRLLEDASVRDQAIINYDIGSLLFDASPDSAIQYYTAALSLSREIHNDTIAARCLNKIGTLHFQSGEYDKAISNIFSALTLFENTRDTFRVMRCLQYLSMAYNEQSMYEQALDYGLQSLDISKSIDDSYSVAVSMMNIGSVYYAQSNYDMALDYFQQALVIMEALEDQQGIADALNNVALIYEKQKDFDKALGYHLRSLSMAKEIGDPRYIAASYHNIGLVYQGMKKYDIGIPYLDSCITLSKMGDDKFYLRESYNTLSSLYSGMGNFEKAYQTHLLYSAINDTLMNEENKRQFAEMNTRYETAKKDNQISLLNKQREIQNLIRNSFMVGFAIVLMFAVVFFWQRNAVKKGKQRSDELLLNILPEEVADELKEKGSAAAKQFDEVTVMFADIKDFTRISENLTPTALVHEIHTWFKTFDDIITKHNIEKIKTIGDAYMCAGGLPVANTTHATDVVKAAMEIRDFMALRQSDSGASGQKPVFEIRIGIHTGPVVAGIVGAKKFAYDIWGDTVNIASRMESSGEAGKVNISASTYELVKDEFSCFHRGKIQAKNKGEIDMYFVERSFSVKKG